MHHPAMRAALLDAMLADAVLVLHGSFILWVMFGAAVVWFRPGLAWLHLPALAWGVGIEFSGAICPLTPIEQQLRRAAGQAGYEGGFIEHYLTAAIYPAGLTHGVQIVIGTALLLANAWAYALIWRRARRRRID
jgi:hypothetical protein